MMPVHRLHGHTPNGAKFEATCRQFWVDEKNEPRTTLFIWFRVYGPQRGQCIRLPPTWDPAWAMVAAWLVLTHKGIEGLDAWLTGKPIVISPTGERV